MTRHILFLCVAGFTLISKFAAAQTASLRISEPTRPQTYLAGMRGMWCVQEGNKYVVLRTGLEGSVVYRIENNITLFDASFKETKTVNIELKYKEEDLDPYQLISFGGKTIIVSSSRERSHNSRKVCLLPFATDKMKVELDKTIMACDLEILDKAPGPGQITTSISEDGTKLLVIGAGDNKEGTRPVYIRVFDTNFNLLWKKDLREKGKSMAYGNTRPWLTNEGEVYLTSIENKSKSDDEDFLYTIGVEHLRQNGTVIDKYILPDIHKKVEDYSLLVDSDGNSRVNGLYSEDKDGDLRGTFSIAIPKGQLKFNDININKIPDNILETLLTKKEIEKGKGLDHYSNFQCALMPNGKSFLTCELEKEYSSQGDVTYKFYEVLVFCFDSDGELIWGTPILKWQSASRLTYGSGSYQVLVDSNKIHLLFNDVQGNLGITPETRYNDIKSFPASVKHGIFMVSINSANGSWSKSVVKGTQEDKLHLNVPYSGRAFGFGEKLVFINKNSKIALGKITLD